MDSFRRKNHPKIWKVMATASDDTTVTWIPRMRFLVQLEPPDFFFCEEQTLDTKVAWNLEIWFFRYVFKDYGSLKFLQQVRAILTLQNDAWTPIFPLKSRLFTRGPLSMFSGAATLESEGLFCDQPENASKNLPLSDGDFSQYGP